MSLNDNLAEPVISVQASHTFCCAEVMKRSPMHWHLPHLPCNSATLPLNPLQSSNHSVHMNTVSELVTFPSNRHFWLAEICQTKLEKSGRVKIFPPTWDTDFVIYRISKWNQSYKYFCANNKATEFAITVPFYFLTKWQLKGQNFLGCISLFHLYKMLITIQYLLKTCLRAGSE